MQLTSRTLDAPLPAQEDDANDHHRDRAERCETAPAYRADDIDVAREALAHFYEPAHAAGLPSVTGW